MEERRSQIPYSGCGEEEMCYFYLIIYFMQPILGGLLLCSKLRYVTSRERKTNPKWQAVCTGAGNLIRLFRFVLYSGLFREVAAGEQGWHKELSERIRHRILSCNLSGRKKIARSPRQMIWRRGGISCACLVDCGQEENLRFVSEPMNKAYCFCCIAASKNN